MPPERAADRARVLTLAPWEDRLPPQDLEAERGSLGSMLLDNDAIPDVLEILEEGDYYRDSHGKFFRHIRALWDAGKAVDAITLFDAMDRGGDYEGAGGDEALAVILDAVPHAANARHYAEIVLQKSVARSLIVESQRIVAAGYEGRNTADELLALAEQAVFAVADRRSRAGGAVSIRLATAEHLADVARRQAGESPTVGTGFAEVDDLLDGLQPERLYILAARPSLGKAQPISEPILTASGFVPMGSLSVGDSVIGSSGLPTRITHVFPQGRLPIFRVTMSDGGSTLCCAEHLWFTQSRNERRRGSSGSVKTTSEIAATLERDNGSPNHALPVARPVVFDPRPYPRLAPYAMGLLLGDGSFRGSCIRFCKPESDLHQKLEIYLPVGDAITICDEAEVRIRRKRRDNGLSATRQILRDYGLDGLGSREKFIPDDYLYAAPDLRLALLRGLLDTDGYVTSGGHSVEYTTSSPRLAEGVAFLARSLGGVVSCRVREPAYTYRGESRIGSPSSRMVIRLPEGMCPVGSEKHLARWRGTSGRNHRSVIAVEPVGEEECRCIRVEAEDHLYVTRDFIVTHNSAFAINVCESLATSEGRRASLLVSLEMNRREIAARLIGGRSGISARRMRTPGELKARDYIRLSRAEEEVCRAEILIDDAPGITMSRIEATARRAVLRRRVALVVVDYIQLVGTSDLGVDNREQQVAAVSRRLKELARRLKVPVLALAQLNRKVDERPDRRPRLSDLRESGSIEQDADAVLLLHRPDYYNPADQPGVAEVCVAKNRCGPTGTVRLLWQPHLTRFVPYAPDPAGGVPADPGEPFLPPEAPY